MDDPAELYRWILGEYEKYKQGIISEQEYLEKLKEYENKISSLQQRHFNNNVLEKIEEEEGVAKTTSVIGLRNLILKELKDKK